VGRIERGGGDGGEPARSPPGWLEFSPAARPHSGGVIRRRAEEVRESARLPPFNQTLHWRPI